MAELPADAPSFLPQGFDFSSLGAQVVNLAPALELLKETWDAQTLRALQEGKIAAPDALINKALAGFAADDGVVTALEMESIGDGKIEIRATTRDYGRVAVTCKVEQFVHNKEQSLLKFKVTDRKLLDDQSLTSWLFSRVSLGMLAKFTGGVDLGPDMAVKVSGDTVTVDFHKALMDSQQGRADLFGWRFFDALQILEAVPQRGNILFKVKLDLPAQVKTMMENVVKP